MDMQEIILCILAALAVGAILAEGWIIAAIYAPSKPAPAPESLSQ